MNPCLICAKPTLESSGYHKHCAQTLFFQAQPPSLEITADEIAELARKSVVQHITIPGVQVKLSMELIRKGGTNGKLTIVGLWGNFILKPPSNQWPELPENEHCTMLLAREAGIEVVPNGLIRLKSGELAYITRRIDRTPDGIKIPMEDMCQLTERLTEDKYKGSHEQLSRVIKKYAQHTMLDVRRYFRTVLLSFVCGNNDMHLKNFSLYAPDRINWHLTPAYDLLCTRLVITEKQDPDELCLTIAGKRSRFSRNHFEQFGFDLGMNPKQIENDIEVFTSRDNAFAEIIASSFLSDVFKQRYLDLINERLSRLKT